MSQLLQASGLTIATSDGAATILQDVSLSLEKGEVVALIGESGAGKSTLALSALGYVKPGLTVMSGKVLFRDMEILSPGLTAPRDFRGRLVSYVAQSAAAAFNPGLTVGWQVAEPLLVHSDRTRHDAHRAAVLLLERLGLPGSAEIARRYPHQLSGGQLQRALAATGLIMTPELLVLDEPTTALDVTTQLGFLVWIKQILRATGMSAIYVSHDLAIVAQVADRCVVMRHGRILEQGATARVLAHPSVAYTRRLLAARDRSELEIGENTVEAAGHLQPSHHGELAANAISVDHRAAGALPIARRRRVVADVSLRIGRGEVIGLIGESGSGKSSIARALAGLHPISKGSLTLDGHRLATSVAGRTRRELQRIQIVFQSPETALNPRASVAASLGRALSRFSERRTDDPASRIGSLLEMVGLSRDFERRSVAQLSGGEKQRLCIARALAATPEYLICDEVLSSLDTIVAQEILVLLKRLQTEYRFGCLFISHDLDVVRGIADRVVVLRHGRVVEEGQTGLVLAAPAHPYTQGLLAAIPEIRPGWLEEAAARMGVGMATAGLEA